MKYVITNIITRTIVIEARNPADALAQADDYANRYEWSADWGSYSIEQMR